MEIIRYHGEIHAILDLKNNEINEKFELEHHIFIELILLAMADTLGSQLKDNNPDDFKFRIDFYKGYLSKKNSFTFSAIN